jgi:hypothetical protein
MSSYREKMYPGMIYVRETNKEKKYYNFDYWTIEHLHSRKGLVCILYIPDEKTRDYVTWVLDKSIQACGQINRDAFITIHNHFFPLSQISE